MKIKTALPSRRRILYISLLLAMSALSFVSPSLVNRISTSPDFTTKAIKCGMNGGCKLHFKGCGFDMSYDNQIMVGSHVCEVDDYFTSPNLLVCNLPRKFYGSHTDLDVVLKVKGTESPCMKGDCNLDILTENTPVLSSVHPSAVFAGDQVTMTGIFRTFNLKDLTEIRVGSKTCLVNEEDLDEVTFHPNANSSFDCKVPLDTEAGAHMVSIRSTPETGYAVIDELSKGFTLGSSSEEFNVRVHPKILSISSNSGYLGGGILEIMGTGFGPDISKIDVKLEDTECKVFAVSDETIWDEEGFSKKSQKIKCVLQPRNSDFTGTLYKGGSGLHNQIYEGRNPSLDSMIAPVTKTLRSKSTILVPENSLKQLDYTQKMVGVFQSNVAGDYTFYISGSDMTKLYLSSQPIDYSTSFDETTLATPTCEIERWTSFREFYKYDSQKCTYTLNANSDYYFLLAHTEAGEDDHVSVGVIAPNSDSSKPNQTPEQHKISISHNPTRQVASITLMNATSGTFTLVFQERDEDSGEVDYFKETGPLAWNVDADTLSEQIRIKVGRTNQVVLVALNAQKNVATNPSEIKGYKWTISFLEFRPKDSLPVVKTTSLVGTGIQSNVTENTPQSPDIAGSFSIRYGNSGPVVIEYNYKGDKMAEELGKIDELFGGVEVYNRGDRDEGYTWYISYPKINGPAQNLVLVNNNLTGGGTGSPSVVIDNNYQAHSTELQYFPISSDFFSTLETSPQITVSVDDVLAGCESETCSYSYLSDNVVPSVSSFNLNGATLSITMTNPPGRILTASSEANTDTIDVYFGGSQCAVVSVSWPTVNFTMPTNSDGSVIIEAGSYYPEIHLKNRGYFKVDQGSVSPHQVDLTISGETPATGSLGGGTVLTISGTGFANKDGLFEKTNTVEIGNSNASERNECEIISYTTSEIKCRTKAKGAYGSTIYLTTNGQTATSSAFSFTDAATPKVSSLSPSNSSPVQKKDLVITGTGFSSDASDFKVWLIPDDASGTTYECNVVSSNSTSITCRLSGGKKGDYRVKVHMEGKGYSMPTSTDKDLFKYRLTVSSITPSSGSVVGGTVLTITGTNFSTILNENQVVIGESGFDYCIILTATATELTCRVNAPQELITTVQKVHVLRMCKKRRIVWEAASSPSPQMTHPPFLPFRPHPAATLRTRQLPETPSLSPAPNSQPHPATPRFRSEGLTLRTSLSFLPPKSPSKCPSFNSAATSPKSRSETRDTQVSIL